jgi:Peptidase S24-like
MIEDRPHSGIFHELTCELIAAGAKFRFQAKGRSMLPTIADGEILYVEPTTAAAVRIADIVLFRDARGFRAHRVVRKRKDIFVTRGDAGQESDRAIRDRQIVGKIVAKESAETRRIVCLSSSRARFRFLLAEIRRYLSTEIVKSWI